MLQSTFRHWPVLYDAPRQVAGIANHRVETLPVNVDTDQAQPVRCHRAHGFAVNSAGCTGYNPDWQQISSRHSDHFCHREGNPHIRAW